MATEAIIMKAVEKGADRQVMHSRVREHSFILGQKVKDGTISTDRAKNEMAFRINDDPLIPLNCDEVYSLFDASQLIGRCSSQVREYLVETIFPILDSEEKEISFDATVNV